MCNVFLVSKGNLLDFHWKLNQRNIETATEMPFWNGQRQEFRGFKPDIMDT